MLRPVLPVQWKNDCIDLICCSAVNNPAPSLKASAVSCPRSLTPGHQPFDRQAERSAAGWRSGVLMASLRAQPHSRRVAVRELDTEPLQRVSNKCCLVQSDGRLAVNALRPVNDGLG